MSSETLTSDQVDNQQDSMYRPVSMLAVLGILLGICSVASLFHPAITVLAAAAIGVSALAMRRIRMDPQRPLGRKAAIIGLCLALFSGLGGWSRYLADQWITLRQVERINQEWFDSLADGNLHRAHQLTRSADSRVAVLDELPALYANDEDMRHELEGYRVIPYIQLLTTLGHDAQIEKLRVLKHKADSRREEITIVYKLTGPTLAQPKFIVITAARQVVARNAIGGWWLHNIFISDDPELKDLQFIHGLA